MTRNKFIGFIAIAFMIFAISAIILSNITSKDKISKTQKDFNQFTDKLFCLMYPPTLLTYIFI